MSEWKQKRFWSEVSVAQEEGGYSVRLDGRAVKTPAKMALQVPTEALAQMIAQEWGDQVETVDPTTMPATRMANAAIDKVRIQHHEVAEMIAEYGATDLLCYRADSPAELAERQAAAWDPALKWAQETYGAVLKSGAGVMHIPQDSQSVKLLSEQVHALTEFQLAAFHDLVSLSGSLVLGLAVMRGWKDPEEIWQMSRLDDQWQQDQWGEDEEASQMAEHKHEAFLHAHRFLQNC